MAAMQRRDSFLMFYVIAFVVVAVAGGAVWWFWHSKQEQLAQDARVRAAHVEAGPTVVVGQSIRGAAMRKINLTGELRPWRVTTLYSKVGGYLSKITVDVGDRVRAGQLIAQIDAPELESEYRSTVADLENRQRIAERTRDLASKGFYSQQALDNADTDVRTSRGRVDTLHTQLGYCSLYAPFAGVVTGRFVDPGALVTNAANNQASSQPVVTVSDASKLRVSAYIEQVDAPFVKVGTETEIIDAANPSRRTKARVSRISGELDARTRTLLAEVDVDNRDDTFMPGAFVNVSLLIPQTSFVEVPATALVVRERRNLVAVVGDDNHIELTPVEIASTDGASVRIASGVNEGVRLALSLPNTIPDGAKINPAAAPVAPPPKPAAPPANPQQPK